MENIKKLIAGIKENKESALIEAIIIYIISFIQFWMLELTSYLSFNPFKLNISLILASFFVIKNIFWIKLTKSLRKGVVISSFITFITSVIFHTIYFYHGSPFLFSDIHNISTAFNSIRNSNPIIMLMHFRNLLFVFMFILCILFAFCFSKKRDLTKKRTKILGLFSGIILLISFFTPIIVEKDPIFFSFEYGTSKYTYLGCLVRQLVLDINPIKTPKDYNEQEVIKYIENYTNNIENINLSSGDSYPDIILILNEAFFDLSTVMDLKQSEGLFDNFYNIDNSSHGYCVVPGIGGGTNKTEFELLTSISMGILSEITPFNSIDLKDANSAVQYFKNLGYTTMATHVMEGSNYNRNRAYSNLEFDEIHFKEDYENLSFWANRDDASDESVYKNIENWYEKMPSSPRFIFCVTMQNHAYYNYNTEKDYIIKEYDDKQRINTNLSEYLSCIKLSIDAFKNLTDYYKNSSRDVLIVMLGDHAPSFCSNNYSEPRYDIIYRSTPLIFWSNNEKIINNFSSQDHVLSHESISSYNIIPYIVDKLNLPRSGYYSNLISLYEKIPVITSNGIIFDSSGNIYNILDCNEEVDNQISTVQKLWYFSLKNPTLNKAFFVSKSYLEE